MERQIAFCNLACNPGSTPHNGVVPHCANRAKARAIGSIARAQTGVNALMLGYEVPLN